MSCGYVAQNKINLIKKIMQKIFFPYCGETMGGSHFSSLTLIKELKKEYDIIIGIHKCGIFFNYCKNNKIKFKFLNINYFSNNKGLVKNAFSLIRNFHNYFNFIKKNKIDIIHINDFRMLNTWALPAYLAGLKKIVFHQRSKMPNTRSVKINLNFATNIISVSKFVRKTLSKKNQRKSKIVINPIKIIKNFQTKSSNTVGFVGNDYKLKRSDIFFNFAERLTQENSKFNFLYIGNISDEKIKIVYNMYPDLKNKIKFTNFLEKPFKIMKTLKLIICPAENEGYGRVPLEAAYLNVPCILSYSGGHKEFKPFNLCLFVKKNKVTEYLKIYKKILKIKLKKKLIQNGIMYNKKYTLPKKHAYQVINIYKS